MAGTKGITSASATETNEGALHHMGNLGMWMLMLLVESRTIRQLMGTLPISLHDPKRDAKR